MSEASVQVGLEEFKQRARRTWALGNYDVVADGIWAAGGVVTGVAGVGPGDEVLDVACGTGNAAIQAAQAGGKVTGLDLTPELFEAGRRRAAEAGVEVEFAVWGRFPEMKVEVLTQTYERLGDRMYRYTSPSFQRDIEVDDAGVVVRYGDDLWQAIEL